MALSEFGCGLQTQFVLHVQPAFLCAMPERESALPVAEEMFPEILVSRDSASCINNRVEVRAIQADFLKTPCAKEYRTDLEIDSKEIEARNGRIIGLGESKASDLRCQRERIERNSPNRDMPLEIQRQIFFDCRSRDIRDEKEAHCSVSSYEEADDGRE